MKIQRIQLGKATSRVGVLVTKNVLCWWSFPAASAARAARSHCCSNVRWVRQLLSAVKHCHDSGLVHNDLKFDNIMCLDENKDLGLLCQVVAWNDEPACAVVAGRVWYADTQSARRLASSAALPKLKLIDFGNAQSSTKKAPVAPELLQWVGDDTVIQKEFACFGLLLKCFDLWDTMSKDCSNNMSETKHLLLLLAPGRNLNYGHDCFGYSPLFAHLLKSRVKKVHLRMTCGSWASSSTSWSLVNHFFRWIATSWNRWMSRESTSQQTRLREPSTFHDFPQSFPQGTWNPWRRFVWRFLIYFDIFWYILIVWCVWQVFVDPGSMQCDAFYVQLRLSIAKRFGNSDLAKWSKQHQTRCRSSCIYSPSLCTFAVALQTVKQVSACLNNNDNNAQSPFVCTSPHPHGHKASPWTFCPRCCRPTETFAGSLVARGKAKVWPVGTSFGMFCKARLKAVNFRQSHAPEVLRQLMPWTTHSFCAFRTEWSPMNKVNPGSTNSGWLSGDVTSKQWWFATLAVTPWTSILGVYSSGADTINGGQTVKPSNLPH